ncbi:hypothetical protein F441_09855 [Phytophthora nicotianae CJ01A1]|uniref:Uncharacterized protein n=1 Tax=Phytophthora nicotianae CJ01A1 TaxID=1317063 RepID=W2WXY0_PHYNI|nr:hypothetical protein F441_09855 [Phytophthora nicotianae CJ01A1]
MKIKWLKKSDLFIVMIATLPPPCLDLMIEHWAPNLACRTRRFVTALPITTKTATRRWMTIVQTRHVPSAKKTNGECFEGGLRALAGGIKSVGDAMKEKATAGADILPSREVVASLTHQEEALKQQTAAINELIGTLREKQ